jgi:hypothetical protein
MHNKVRASFCTGDWFIDSNEPTPNSPFQIFKTTFVSGNQLVGESFRFSNSSTNLLIKSQSVKILPISQRIKASVFHLQGNFFYCGNYLTSKLLLSRIYWQCNDIKKIFFFDFSISSIYKALLFKKDKTIPALLRWERILTFSISPSWKSMLKYLHDPILENKTKEVLFKIYSQVLPVGTNVEKFGYATTCSFCQQIEDEIHLFVTCPRISNIWVWLHNSVLCHYPTLINNQLSPWEKLIGFNKKMPSSTLQVWKVIHAETIRRIWASRCKKVFEDADTHFLELKAKLVAQIEYKLTIHANLLQSRPKKAEALEHFKRVWTQKIPIASISITNKGSLKFTLNI